MDLFRSANSAIVFRRQLSQIGDVLYHKRSFIVVCLYPERLTAPMAQTARDRQVRN